MRARATEGWREHPPVLLRCLAVAFANLIQHRTRLFAGIAGTAVPIVLLFLQMAFLNGARYEVSRLYEDFDFDLAMVSRSYQFLYSSGTFDRVRLIQAKAAAPIADTFSLNADSSYWTDPATGKESSLFVIGVDDNAGFVQDEGMKAGLPLLQSRAVLVDAFSDSDFGPLIPGVEGSVAGQPVSIAGLFQLGLFFYADGSTLVRNDDFPRFTGQPSNETSIGLVRLLPGADGQDVKRQLAAALPPDVRVLTRGELIAAEQRFFISTKPIGIMLNISMLIAFAVGAVILLQVLGAEIVNRVREFATLKAMGFSPGFVFGVGLAESALLALGAFVPALMVGGIILWAVESATHLPAGLTFGVVLSVLLIVAFMTLLAVGAIVSRIARADPAELY